MVVVWGDFGDISVPSEELRTSCLKLGFRVKFWKWYILNNVGKKTPPGNIYLEEWLFGAVVSRSGGRLVRGPFHCCQDILLVRRLLDIFAIWYWSWCGDIAKFEIALCADAWKILLSLKGLDSFDSSLSLLSFSKPSCWHNQTSVQCKIINFYFHFNNYFMK